MWIPFLIVMAILLTGVALGVALTWWRWKASLQILDRATEWKTTAGAIEAETKSQREYLVKMDETMGRLADYVRLHVKVTTPPNLRSAVAKMVGEDPPPKPEAGWSAPVPEFEEGNARPLRRGASVPRGL